VRGLPLLGLLALLHLYIGLRLLAPFPTWWPGALALAALYALLVSTRQRVFSHRADPPIALWAGLIALGFFSSLWAWTVLRDLTLLIGWALPQTGFVPTDADYGTVSAQLVPVIAAVSTLVGLFNARRPPRVRELNIPIADLPAALEGFSIVQITDLHVGPTIRDRFVRRVVERVNALQPDLIAVTGDVIDGPVRDVRPHTDALGELRARHGVFAVTGNHEYYSGAHAWIDEFRRLGMTVLMNQHAVLQHNGAPLLVAGVPDYSAGHFDRAHASDPQAALSGAPAGLRPRVLLAHQPRTADAAEAAGFDLQLSGHTHGGQFWPWNLFVPLQQPYVAGLHRHGTMWIYISRGTGYWGPPKRLGAPSEITRLRLVRAAA
jgi:predicted MPP superfamily phosphohydrolase